MLTRVYLYTWFFYDAVAMRHIPAHLNSGSAVLFLKITNFGLILILSVNWSYLHAQNRIELNTELMKSTFKSTYKRGL